MSFKGMLLISVSVQAALGLITVIIGLIKGKITGTCDKDLIKMGLQNIGFAIWVYCLSMLI